MPPIKCIPCRVTYEGNRWEVAADGHVRSISGVFADFFGPWIHPNSETAKKVRREASRLRRNRNARERHAAMRDLGMKRTSYGYE